ncbi:hypothetical protein H5410_030226 [Solanum commersonii]|uniref:Uncharacterized protein n=1 Tax=Solanum commersonii TaxID=4109 RepID=A0A9J5YGU4_SOLCO|nr:hypothetical protein H5410_030226 [Solanum commersonii]
MVNIAVYHYVSLSINVPPIEASSKCPHQPHAFVYLQEVGPRDPKPTAMRLLMADGPRKRPIGSHHPRETISRYCMAQWLIWKRDDEIRLNNEEVHEGNGSSKQDSAITYEWRVGRHRLKSLLGVEALANAMMNFDSDGIEEYNELVAALDKHEYRSKPKKYEL